MRFYILACCLAAVLANDIIEGEYMMRVNPELVKNDAEFTTLLKTFDVDVQKFFHMKSLDLLHVKADEKAIARVRGLPEVLYVEPNQWFYTTQTCSAVPHSGVWGLDRIDQSADLPYTDPADTSATYTWDANDGSGTTAYIVDTGIRTTHNEFGTRARWGHSAGLLPSEDDNGHGTHCAGTVGSDGYGVAKGVSLVAVKVLNSNGSGSTSNVIEGVDWAAADCTGDCTMNMSLGGGISSTLDAAIADAVTAGVTVVCAAGNSDANACNSSPGREPTCITVGATEVDDQTATYTNYGSCVDIFAPGTSILSTWHLTDSSTNRISGTSMACPHVVGAANRYLSANPGHSPAQVVAGLTSAATPNTIQFRAGHETGSPDLLLFTTGC